MASIVTFMLLATPLAASDMCMPTELPGNLAPADIDRAQQAALLAKEPACMRAHYLLGYSWLGEENRDTRKAIEHLEHARELAPENSSLLMLLGQVYLMRASEESSLSDAGDGREALEQAVEADPDNLDARSALAGFHRAAPWIAGGDMDVAREQAREIRKRDLKRGIVEQARNLVADDEVEKAVELVKPMLESFPGDEPLAMEYALLMQREKRFDEAHRVLAKAAESAPKNLNLLYQVGRNAALGGQFLDAGRAALQRYLATDGDDMPIPRAAAWWRLGLVEQHAGNMEAARAAFEKSLAIDPDYEAAHKALEAIADPAHSSPQE